MGYDRVDGISKSITPFIERSFTLSPDEGGMATFSLPEIVHPRLWQCSYRIAWPTHELTCNAYGLDGVQALLLAMENLHRRLLTEAAYKEELFPSGNGMSALTWMSQRDLGLPLPGTVHTGTFQAHLLANVEKDGFDLDHIILHECAVDYRKVAMIAGTSLNAVGARSRSAKLYGDIGNDEPDLFLEAVLSRLSVLVDTGVLEVQGDLSWPRCSEVRRSSK